VSLELVVGLLLAVVGGVARWRTLEWQASPLGQANAALDRGRQRHRWRWRSTTRIERWHAVEWSILVVVGLLFLSWAAAPFVSELVGTWRAD
jgi:hypothetical protein